MALLDFKQKRLSCFAYVILTLWGMSSWIDINSIFVQLPYIIQDAPEGAALPAALSLAIQLGNIGPIFLMIVQRRRMFGWRNAGEGTKPPCVVSAFIYAIILINTCGSFILAGTWRLNNGKRSYPLIFITFCFAVASTSSSLAFYDYVKRYASLFSLNALLFGESLSSVIPPSLTLIQSRINSASRNETAGLELSFSTSTFFIVIGSLVVLSLVAFVVLDLGYVSYPASSQDIPIESKGQAKIEEYKDSKVKRDVVRLLSLSLFVNFLNFGVLPALTSFSTLPYGGRTYFLSSTATPFTNTLAVVIGLFLPTTRALWKLLFLICTGVVGTVYIVTVAATNPCPPLCGTDAGSAIIVAVWVVVTLIFCYARLLIVNRIRLIDPSKMFWFGASVQLGGFLGAMPMYLIAYQFNLIKSNGTCDPVLCRS